MSVSLGHLAANKYPPLPTLESRMLAEVTMVMLPWRRSCWEPVINELLLIPAFILKCLLGTIVMLPWRL